MKSDELNDLTEFIPDFLIEADEHLDNMEKKLILLEKNPDNMKIIDDIFRSAHTLKGGASSLKFDKTAQITHLIENIFDNIRQGKTQITIEITDIILETIDILRMLKEHISNSNAEPDTFNDSIIKKLSHMKDDIKQVDDSDKLQSAVVDKKKSEIMEEQLDDVQLEALKSLDVTTLSGEKMVRTPEKGSGEKLEDNQNFGKFVSFNVTNENFCLSVDNIKEVIDYIGITSLPFVEDYIIGIINLRGNIIPVIDLHSRLTGTSNNINYNENENHILISSYNEVTVGLLIDEVVDIFEINLEEIQKIDTLSSNIVANKEFINGIIHHDELMMIYLNVDAIFDRQRNV